MEDILKILETIPNPVFIALHSGVIVYGNGALATAAGQPDLAGLDRTLFGLGVFHNAAELRGFLTSFQHGGPTRRLVLPTLNLTTSARSLMLHASIIEWEKKPAICGILTRHKKHSAVEYDVSDRIGQFVLVVDGQGKLAYINASLADSIGIDRNAPLPPYHKIDVEHGITELQWMVKATDKIGDIEYETNFQRSDGTLMPVKAVIKPDDRDATKGQLLIVADDITDWRKLQGQVETLMLEVKSLRHVETKKRAPAGDSNKKSDQYTIVSANEGYGRILEQIDQVARTDSTVLITGETGTGKELIARAIHRHSARSEEPLIILNCGALPADLIESELFGYRKGAFTGADRDYPGRFEIADNGTLFLDEMGEMPILLQTRLLRFLQDGEFMPLGARASVTANVRVVAATNRDLRARVKAGEFRADLFYRLNVFPIHSIPLRERREDIPILINHFISKYSPAGFGPPKLRPSDLRRLREYHFTGNVRELENIIQRAIITAKDNVLNIVLEEEVDGVSSDEDQLQEGKEHEILTFEEVQRRHILHTLERTGGKVSGPGGAAELLALKPQTLFSKMRKLDIQRK